MLALEQAVDMVRMATTLRSGVLPQSVVVQAAQRIPMGKTEDRAVELVKITRRRLTVVMLSSLERTLVSIPMLEMMGRAEVGTLLVVVVEPENPGRTAMGRMGRVAVMG
jgi:hypothetical protein